MTIDSITREALVEKLKQYPTLLQQFLVLVETQGTTLDDIQEILKLADEANKNSESAVKTADSTSKALVSEVNRALTEELALQSDVTKLKNKDIELQSNIDKKVSLSGDEIIEGTKTFISHVKTNEVDNENGNAMLRFKSTEEKNVVGGSSYDLTLMGKGDRPTYSKDGSNFEGKEIALIGDATTLYIHNLNVHLNLNDDIINIIVLSNISTTLTLSDLIEQMQYGKILPVYTSKYLDYGSARYNPPTLIYYNNKLYILYVNRPSESQSATLSHYCSIIDAINYDTVTKL